MSTSPESPSSIHEVANSDSPSVASHKRKRGSSEESTTSRSLEQEEPSSEEDHDDESRHYTSRKSIGHLEDLLEEVKALPESNERNANIKELEDFAKALDSCRRYQKLIDENDLESIIEMAEGEQFIEKLIRDGLRRAESVSPKNEDVARALSYFMGPSGEEEVKKLVATVTYTMLALGETNDVDILRRNAEPHIINHIVNWKDEERRAGLEKLFGFDRALW